MARSPRERISTSRLLTMIRGARSFQEATAYHAVTPDPRFHETLYEMMELKGLTARDMIRKTGIERSYFYHILSGQKTPGRNMVLRIGFCLSLNLKEMNRLLQLSGTAPLYPRIRRDASLIFALQNHYSMSEANDLLIHAAEEPLFLKDESK